MSVGPILELTSKRRNIKSILLTCNTMEELKYKLEISPRKRGYGLLYLAFHGKPGLIVMDGTPVEIEVLAGLMGKRFADWSIHFGSCATMNIEKYRVSNFLLATGALIVTGYQKYTDWMEASALDLLLLDWVQNYRDMRKFWDGFRKTYRDLVQMTGLAAFHRE
jgi:hypothetical protein